MTIALKNALLCINCDYIYCGFENEECPQCTSIHSIKIKKYLYPLITDRLEERKLAAQNKKSINKFRLITREQHLGTNLMKAMEE